MIFSNICPQGVRGRGPKVPLQLSGTNSIPVAPRKGFGVPPAAREDRDEGMDVDEGMNGRRVDDELLEQVRRNLISFMMA
jgi:hypothetical protein